MTRRRLLSRKSHLTQWERQYQCAPTRRKTEASLPRHTADTPNSAGSVSTLLLAGVLVCSSAGISNAQSLPVRTLPVPMVNFATSGIANVVTSGANMTVNQLSERAILNWNSFNISSDSAVRFNQPGSTSVALNRIFDANPSIIQGQLSANGQIYLINRNGILFDRGSQINVNTLIASSLDINDTLFNNGILSSAAFGPVFQQNAGQPAGAVIVEAGARIQTDSGGRVLLMAPSVINRGDIRTPDGQTILAAGNKIYLRSGDENLRGFLVEVDTGLVAPDPAKAAVNEGTITAERGNITMVGLAVRQSGILTATTTATASGSIVLKARDGGDTALPGNGVALQDSRVLTSPLVTKRAGTVDLTAGSLTEVAIDSGNGASIDANGYNPSRIDISGNRIVHEGRIAAPSGNVTLTAVEHPSVASRNNSRIFLANGSEIDVSGTAGTVLPMSSNLLTVELRGDELKDFPLQRDGILRGQKVVIDVNKGTTVADVSKQIAGVPRGIGEISSVGGNVKLESEGDIVMQRQATINVSGGKVAYQSGPLYTSKLVSQGRVYDIGTASPDRDYEAILNGADYSIQVKKWNVTQTFDVGRSLQRDTPGYVKGGSAGSVSFKAHGLALDGILLGNVVAGPNQREAGKWPTAGLLEVADYANVGNATPQTRIHDVVFQADATAAAPVAPGDALATDQPLVLSTNALANGGFSRVKIERNGSIEVPQGADLNMPAGGSVALKGYSINVDANISVPGGSIDLQTVSDITKTAQQQGVLSIGPNSTLSTRGLWVNDLPAVAGPQFAGGPALINAGNINLSAVADLRLGAVNGDQVSPTVLDVSGGGWISASGSFRAGNGGNLTIGGDGTVQLGAVIRGMAPGAGGTLTLRAPDVTIRNGASSASAEGPTLAAGDIAQSGTSLTLPSWMFNSLGFTTYEVKTSTKNIFANSSSLAVAPNTDLNPLAPFLVTTLDARLRPTGSDIYEFTRVEARPDLRRVANLTLDHAAGPGTSVLTVGQGARIHTDPGAKVTLSTNAGMVIDGSIEAPAGAITLNLKEVSGQPYSPVQSIWLGADSLLSAAGAVKLTPDPLGRQIGTVLDGGSVVIAANRGTVVAEAGSRIDVSGAQAGLDVPTAMGTRERQTVASNAGAISITAAEGMLLDGELIGRPGGAGASGGALSLTLTTRNRGDDGTPTGPGQVSSFPPGDRVISLRAGDAMAVPAALTPGMPIQNETANDLTGLALFNTNKLATGGFTEFTAKSDQEIRFADNMALTLGRSITLDAPQINVSNHIVTISSPYVALGSSDIDVRFQQTAPTPMSGTGALGVNASLIELVGNSAVSGASAVSLASTGDIRARGVRNAANQITGAFTAGGTLELEAAQVYPTTFSQFAIKSTGDMLVSPSGGDSSVPLSAGGVLKLEAPNITVDGTLRAPFGSVELTASDTLALTPRSLVSVSGAGMLTPFGATQNGLEWVYNPANGINLLVDRPAEKNVRLKGANVNLSPGATVDLSGGGDLYAYEFVPGPGGSKDALANVVDGKSSTMFAVMPGLNSAYAPYDQQYYLDSTLKPGDSVYLAGGGGLAAGTYALLPARYALLPGAFLIKPATGVSSIIPGRNTAQLDGTPVVAGYRTAAGTGTFDNRWTAYAIQPGSAGRTLAEYRDASANTFFAAGAQAAGTQTPPLPADAGRLVLDVTQSLALAGARLQTAHAPGTRGAEVDISATRLAITSPDSVNTSGLSGYVQVNASDLTALNAESLLLGGTRTPTAEGVDVRVISQDVVVANTAANPLRAPEVIIAANDTVTVRSGAVVEGVGARAGSDIAIGYQFDPAKPVTGAAQIARRDINRDGRVDVADNIDGRGALLRVSGGDQVQVTRANVIDRTRGTLEVQADARVVGNRSLILDATRDTLVRSGARLGAGTLSRDTNGDGIIDGNDNRVGGAASLSAGLISAGDTASANGGLGVDRGLLLSTALLDQLRGLDTLSLKSYSTIDFYSATQVGGIDSATGKPFLANLELNSAGIVGHNNAGTTSSLFAGSVLLANTVGAGFAGTPNGTGRLNINADRVTFGAGDKAISGFSNVAITAGTEIRTEGAGSTKVAGGLSLDAPRLTAGVASRQSLSAERDNGASGMEYFPLFISASGALPAMAAAADSVGAQLTITGASIQHGGVIDLPGGVVTLSAKGTTAGGGDVHLTTGSSVSARGVSRTLAGVPVNAPAGAVNLVSEQGNVLIDAGARVDVSSGNSDAGKITVSAAQGVAAINGELAGSAPADSRSGVFTLDARYLNGDIAQTTNDFSPLNSRLNSGGFTAERSIRARAGDLTVAAGDTVTARTVELVADGGKIDVNGTIDARGPNGGSVLLAARGDVSLNPGGTLRANATTEGGSGGNVTASSTSGQIVFADGSLVDVNKFAYASSQINVVATGHTVPGGAASAYTAELAVAPGAYTKGMDVVFRASDNSLGASTLSVNGLAPKTIKRFDGTNITADDIRAGEIVKLTYDGTYFRLPPGDKGTVLLRASRTPAGNDVAVTARGVITGAREIVAEGVKVYNANTISNGADSATNLSTLASGIANTEAANFVLDTNFNSNGVRRRLSNSVAEVFRVRPGVEVRSDGDLTVSGDPWNFFNSVSSLSWRYNGEPGALTVVAPGNISINTSISDGFSTATTAGVLQDTLSWSYRFTSGADLSSASTAAVLPLSGNGALAADKGNLTVAAGALVRTGTGSIDMVSGRDFVLEKSAFGTNLPSAAVYTAGRPSESLLLPTSYSEVFPNPPNIGRLNTNPLAQASFPTGGGDLNISAQRDILGAISPQLMSEWLVRRGAVNETTGAIISNRNTGWGIDFAKFNQNTGALGGGDVSVTSGRDISNLSVMLPTTGRLPGAADSQPDASKLVVTGGGDLTVIAGGNIRSGVYYVGRGEGTIRAGDSIVAGRTVGDSNPASATSLPVHTVLAVGDGRFDVRAAREVNLETVLNPTVVVQDITSNKSYFYTYSPNAAVKLDALSGDVTLHNNLAGLTSSALKLKFADSGNLGDADALVVYPGKLDVYAGLGDIKIGGKFTMYPSPRGNLHLIAGGSVNFDYNGSSIVNLSDADPALLVNPLSPSAIYGGDTAAINTFTRLSTSGLARVLHASTPVHQQDENNPVRIVAAAGSITGGDLHFSKPAQLYAGVDVRDITFKGQNLRPGDVTSIIAGRDVVFGTSRDAAGLQEKNDKGLILGGPGKLEIEAGRNVDLGNSVGVVTRANLINPALPPSGADITIGAGISSTPGYGAFVTKYFTASEQIAVAQYARTQTGDASLSDAAAIAAFDKLPRPTQLAAPFMSDIRSRFYNELKLSGREAGQPGGNYQRGFGAIATLFPDTVYRGDLSLLFSQIKTESGGRIDLLVPGGRVNAGQTTPPPVNANLPAGVGAPKKSDQLGILVFENGAIHAFSKGDFAVNESRVFTLQGGDILIWSSDGDIDAGRGAKTAVSAPAPVLVTDSNGNTSYKFQSVSGSGIRSILTRSDIVPGSVDLIAPRGTVNAGDAGIGSAGDINIAALRVVGADNIQVGGKSSGVPLGDSGGAGRGLSGISNAGSDATRSVEQATRNLGGTPAESFRPGLISVEVLGIGNP